eukprot:CAMPEP_0179009938 /NCGR_PEP_ID=MMETSP0795-20121207/16537_1 /TAXON_ID=88552 /ORGANISM="Amoebophrya sp., Strain Ameob2" /LENGTH=1119 /DNA_ID=CAMNT_0020705165 /DNA_START=259 /DNA_END=3618 /DNA_ORIENTATION=-
MAQPAGAASIYVAIRVRPFVPREKKAKEDTCVECRHPEINLINKNSGSVQTFELDEIWDSSCSPSNPLYFDQDKVYNKMGRSILEVVEDGYNAALFAYGQTGSGKTTSIMGDMNPPKERGILPRLLFDLFEFYTAAGWKVDVRVRMLEIYNERIQDLLRPNVNAGGPGGATQKKLDVRMHPKLGVYVPDLTINAVETASDCIHLLEYGITMKTVAATQMNAQSSRAHTIFAMKIEKEIKEGYGERHESNEVFIVDLAGRENERTTLATGERLVELSFINKSLFHLANCIHALGSSQQGQTGPAGGAVGDTKGGRGGAAGAAAAGQQGNRAAGQHAKVSTQRDISTANFRNSKLTLLLSEALSGNSKTYMIGTLSPATSAYEENQVTLRFAATVKNIKLKVSKIEVSKTDQVSALNDELTRLREQLANAPAASGGKSNALTQELQEQLDATNAALAEKHLSWEDARKEAEKNAEERNRMLKKLGVQQQKFQQHLDKIKAQYVVPLPYISNEAADPFMSGRIEYSFAGTDGSGGSYYMGADYEALVKYAVELDVADGSSGFRESVIRDSSGDLVDRDDCLQIRGLGVSAKLCRFDAHIGERTPRNNSKGTGAARTFRVSRLNADLDDELAALEQQALLPNNANNDNINTTDKDIRLTVTRISNEGNVMLNNELLEVGQPYQIQQGDKVTLGRAYIFRCYLTAGEDQSKPKSERGANCMMTPRHRRSRYASTQTLEKCVKDLIGDEQASDATKLYLAKQYISNLKHLSIDAEPRVFGFLYECKKAKHLVEEANEITNAVRPQDNLRFELDTMAPVLFTGYSQQNFLPQLLVRVVRVLTFAQKRWHAIRHRIHYAKGHILSPNHLKEYDEEIHKHPEAHPEEEYELLFVWSMTKFLGRLDMMRDIYHNWMTGVSFFVDLKEDPWVEAGPVEMEFWMKEKEEEKDAEIAALNDEISALKQASRKKVGTKDGSSGGGAAEADASAYYAAKVKIEALEKENADLKKSGGGSEGKGGAAFLEEKQKMLDRFQNEKQNLKDELEKRLGDFKKKTEKEKVTITADAEADKLQMRKAFEEEKNSMRKQFKLDLENIRKMEQEDMEIKYQQHEQQIATLNELLAEALSKSK